MKRYQCLFFGAATYDLLFLVDRVPDSDERIEAYQMACSGGGPAATASVALQSLGKKSGLVSAVGDDPIGRLIVHELKDKVVDVTGIRTLTGRPSPLSVIHVEKGTGKRTITYYGGCLKYLDLSEINMDILSYTNSVHLDGNNFELALSIAKYCRQHTQTIISLDGGNIPGDKVMKILPYIDIFILDDKSTRNICGNIPFKEACRLFHDRGAKIVGITLGDKGSLAYDGNYFYHAPSFTVNVIDTTGAGDNFHGAFLYGYLEGWTLPETIRFANAFAALTCRGLGGRAAIPSIQETEQLVELTPGYEVRSYT
ncbi:PfkB family carbohydrate kinase [Moorella naiadis]|uniref:carbohydrate kinase family protein n=1 Tax=Moorella naiadis (nom. illeg.) TaxID=3093670 RepID=UPI003D9CA2D5